MVEKSSFVSLSSEHYLLCCMCAEQRLKDEIEGARDKRISERKSLRMAPYEGFLPTYMGRHSKLSPKNSFVGDGGSRATSKTDSRIASKTGSSKSSNPRVGSKVKVVAHSDNNDDDPVTPATTAATASVAKD